MKTRSDGTTRPSGPRTALVVEQLWQPVPGGSGRYVVELARSLTDLGAPITGLAALHPDSPTPRDLDLPPMPIRRSRLVRPVLYEAWNRLEHPLAESLAPDADLVHATTWAVPGTHLPLVVTVHDTAFLRAPEHFTRRGNAYFLRALERTIRHADRVVVPSKATADDCVAAGIDATRIVVIPHGVRTIPVTDEKVERFRAANGLTRGYILWTGTREPRKNLPTLLRAFALLGRPFDEIDLVLVGPEGWGDDAVERSLVRELGARVHVLGRLSDDDLAAAYTGASVFAFPSVWEGFGLPVLEAMAHGAPVVTSRGTCMQEVCGDAGLLAASDSPEEIATQLARALGEEHDALVVAGRQRAATFTWEACAQAHIAVYADVTR